MNEDALQILTALRHVYESLVGLQDARALAGDLDALTMHRDFGTTADQIRQQEAAMHVRWQEGHYVEL